ncbi:MAG: hypothetical protein IJL67_06870 [Oscillospiraceae bacterium]|nr:hypothetical protein [Oscillospiraceae bacterium]
MADFSLDYNINNPDDFNEALHIFEEWESSNDGVNDQNVTVKNVIESKNPRSYKKLSRGDKCRLGRQVSCGYATNKYKNIELGRKKGCTKTYSKKV